MKTYTKLYKNEALGRNYVNILGVNVDSTSVPSLLRKVQSDIRNKRKFFIVTPNPEQIMLAQKDKNYLRVLNKADISIPDAVGVVAAYRFLTLPDAKGILKTPLTVLEELFVWSSIVMNRRWLEKKMKVIKGRELFMELIKLANKKGWRIFLLGGLEDEAAGTKAKLERNYKNIKIKVNAGPLLDKDAVPLNKTELAKETEAIKEINSFSPHILFVGISHPRQEKWLAKNLRYINAGGAMVVGGTYRYISGKAKLPPKMVSDAGLEWLWRLLTGSQKLDRIITAFPLFSLKVLKAKLREG